MPKKRIFVIFDSKLVSDMYCRECSHLLILKNFVRCWQIDLCAGDASL